MDRELVTDSEEVLRIFTKSRAGKRVFDAWRRRKPHVTERVMEHRTSAVYKLASSEIRSLTSEHALGRLRPSEGYQVESIRDWRPDFAFSHIFHFHLEERGRMYSFQEFREWSRLDRFRPMLHTPAWEEVKKAIGVGYSEQQAKDSVRWRIGLAYYSFVREMYVVARLRELGLDACFHPLADALFRTDTWIGTTSVSLYIKNQKFRDGQTGRKPPAEKLLGGEESGLKFIELGIPTQRLWGEVHFPDEAAVDACAKRLHQLSTQLWKAPGSL
ncbi:hypothetical protein [Nocardiopsis aegyptia]|uniref:Uncharacterized protein n=1 Tax=Nocardiopsis aegyptia TaxID=220378 RepID=A0A7Z0JBZ3_9ACTN|nr:hypothetical protein [Nocardiopsis aegyptia]NYJ35929.1 hypothetical protein [Nocardiopsis aegyptia]